MSWEDDTLGPDVAAAGRLISERIGRDLAGQLDLEEALEASRYSSHPYSSHPKEVNVVFFFGPFMRKLGFMCFVKLNCFYNQLQVIGFLGYRHINSYDL